jgi:7-carboxy-7-deazaguanine synthase
MGSLRVTEIFHSIQGEGTRAGTPCAFVRLTGCPMRCVWCDTAYAFEGGESLTIPAILERIAPFGCSLVEVTGGEPLAQKDTPALLSRLADAGYTVLVETGGGVPVEGLDPRAILIYDVKCPDSGELEHNLWDNLPRLKPHVDEVKFVLASRRDYEWALEFVTQRGLAARHTVLFAPAWGLQDPAALAGWMLADRAPARLQLQIHKILWGADARGV